MPGEKIKAILFDFHGVLAFKKKNYQPDLTVDEIDEMIGGCVDDAAFKSRAMEKYALKEEDFNLILDKIAGKYEKFSGIWKLLPELRKKYKLAIINNGTFLTVSRFDAKFLIRKNFDFFISSAIEGIRKPDVKIFLLAAQRLGVLPEECLFMDDLKTNIDGAAAAGLEVIWWENKESGFEKFCDFCKKSDFVKN